MKKNIVKKAIKTAALQSASKHANSVCALIFYQPKLPEAVKKLRRF